MTNQTIRDLRIALERMRQTEGPRAVDALLNEAARAAATDDDLRAARKLSNGVRSMGVPTGLAIMAAVGLKVLETEERS